ncbi:MAG TPA: nuclear transport factor 2 family protein [Thiobacillus sp.]
MQAIEQAITGARYPDLAGNTPESALEQFYAAFNGRDLALMAENWAQTDEIALDNPLGGIRRGWAEIRPLYERVFCGAAVVYVEFYDYTLHVGQDLFYAVGRERGQFRRGGTELALAIRTSRVFRQFDGRWKQVHHHGSIENPELLARYQSAVLGNQ